MIGVAALTLSLATLVAGLPMDADVGPNPLKSKVIIQAERKIPGNDGPTIGPVDDGPPRDYTWLLACSQNRPGAPMYECQASRRCDDPAESLWLLWTRILPHGDWEPGTTQCLGKPPKEAPPRPQVTPDRVLEAVRRLGLPSLRVHIQPAGETLVNFETIFYATPPVFERTVQILGYQVDVAASPSAYRWDFGDGDVQSTDSPGAPYPAQDVVHEYADAHTSVQPAVDVTYQVRYRIDGGQWEQLDQTLTAQGPAADLRIREASAVLTGG